MTTTDHPMPSTTCTLLADDAAPAAARRLLATVCHGGGIGGDVIADAELVVSELVANAVEHGDGGPLEVHVVRVGHSAIELTVRNRTHGSLPPEPWAMPGPEAVRGRGLAVVSRLATSVECWDDRGRIAVRVVVG